MDIVYARSEEEYTPALERVIAVLRENGTVVIPTDTLYALACNALEPAALGRVFDIKKRVYTAAVPVLVRNAQWARELMHADERSERIMDDFWPGKVTVIADKKAIVPAMATGGGQTLGVRAPDHPFTLQLLASFGYPLSGTSANISGQEPSNDPADIETMFARHARAPDLIVDAGVLPPSEPSTVVDLSGARARIVRQGAVRADKLFSYL